MRTETTLMTTLALRISLIHFNCWNQEMTMMIMIVQMEKKKTKWKKKANIKVKEE